MAAAHMRAFLVWPIPEILAFALLFFVFYGSTLASGAMSSNDLHGSFINKERMAEYLNGPNSWERGIGGGSPNLDFGYPVYLAQALFSKAFNADFSFIERFFWLYPSVLIALISSYYLASVLFKNRIASFFTALFYTFNSFNFNLWTYGWLSMIPAYALMPLMLAFFIKGVNGGKLRFQIAAAALFSVQTYFDIRIAYIAFFVVVLYALYCFFALLASGRSPIKSATQSVRGLLLLPVFAAALNSFWLLPFITRGTPLLPAAITSVSFVSGLGGSYSTAASFAALHFGIGEAASVYGWGIAIFFLVPILVFSSLLLHRQNRYVLFFSLLALITVFLTKVVSPPFEQLYVFLFQNLPGFNAFRSPEKWYTVLMLAFAPLVGITVGAVHSKLKHGGKRILALTFLLAIFSLIMGSALAAKGLIIYGNFVPAPIPEEFRLVDGIINAQGDDFRVIWLPHLPQYMFFTQKHPIFGRTYAVGLDTGPGVDFHNYLLWNSFYSDPAPHRLKPLEEQSKYFAKVLGLTNSKYVILAPQGSGKEPDMWKSIGEDKADYERIMGLQDGLLRVGGIFEDENIRVYENNNAVRLFFMPGDSAVVVGGKDALFRIAPYVNFSKWALVFAEQEGSEVIDSIRRSDAIVFYEKTAEDLVLASLDAKRILNLWNYGAPHGSKGVWSKAATAAGVNFLIDQFGEFALSMSGVVYATNEATFNVPFEISNNDEYELWLRAGSWNGSMPRYGTPAMLSVALDGMQVYQKKTASDRAKFLWIRLGAFKFDAGGHVVSFKNGPDGSNFLDRLAVVPSVELNAQRERIANLLAQKRVLVLNGTDESARRFFDVSDGESTVDWRMVAPTKYAINITISKPGYVLFADNFNKDWVLTIGDRRIRSQVAYGFMNSFYIENAGAYAGYAEFTEQQYSSWGWYVTLAGWLLVAGYFVRSLLTSRRAQQHG